MTQFKALYLSGTPISDLTLIANMTQLTWLHLSGTQVKDLRPIRGLSQLGTYKRFSGLTFKNTPATTLDPDLKPLSQIQNDQERAAKTLAYLNALDDTA